MPEKRNGGTLPPPPPTPSPFLLIMRHADFLVFFYTLILYLCLLVLRPFLLYSSPTAFLLCKLFYYNSEIISKASSFLLYLTAE